VIDRGHIRTDPAASEKESVLRDAARAGSRTGALAPASPPGSHEVLTSASADGGHIDARTAPQPIPDDQLAGYLESVSQNGATDLSQAVPIDIDGVSGVVITYTLTSASGISSKNEDMVVNQGGNTYDIVLNTATAAFPNDTSALQAVLDGWRWR